MSATLKAIRSAASELAELARTIRSGQASVNIDAEQTIKQARRAIRTTVRRVVRDELSPAVRTMIREELRPAVTETLAEVRTTVKNIPHDLLEIGGTSEGRKKIMQFMGAFAAAPLVAAGIYQGITVATSAIKARIASAAQRELQRGFYEVIRPQHMPDLSFDHIIGHGSAKEQLLSFMRKSETPAFNRALNKNDPRSNMNNVLLVGPPGTGKTQLARTLASNLNKLDRKGGTMFLSVDVEKLAQLEAGTGPKNVKKLEQIIQKSKANRVVLFMDELDGLVGDDTRAALLKLIDGVKPIKDKELLVIGATNHARRLDDALVNRFREMIYLSAPSPAELKQMYSLYFTQKGLKVDAQGLDWDVVLKESGGFTGRTVEQATAHLKNAMLDRMPKAEKLAWEKRIRKKGDKALEGFSFTFSQQDLLEAIRAVQKPKYQTIA